MVRVVVVVAVAAVVADLITAATRKMRSTRR